MHLDDLKPAPYNPRDITPEAAQALRYSLESFGDLSGIVWNRRSGHLVAGHQRVEQLRGSGAQVQGQAVVLGDLVFPVRVVDWDADTELAANLTANNQALAGYFTDELPGLVEALRTGLTPEEVDNLRLGALCAPLDDVQGDPPALGLAEATDSPDEPLEPPKDEPVFFSVVIDFATEAEQIEFADALESQGYTCRLGA